MSAPQELILSASSTPSSEKSSSSTTSAIHLHDLLTSSPVHAFKPSVSAVHSFTAVPTQDGVGGGLFVLQEGKAIVHVWSWQKDQIQVKLHLPEKLSCFAVSPNGIWAAGGSPSGQIYLWELASGLLHATFPAHYRTVTTLRFTPDSRILLSSSLDSAVHVYLVSRLFDRSSSFHKPYGALTDHTLPIRDVHLSHTSSVSGGRCWTASEDGTVKVWSLHPPFDLLCTFTFPPGTIPSTIAVDPTERFFCVGTEQGQVYHVAMFRRRGQIGDVNGGDLEAVGGGGIGEPGVKAGPSVFSSKSSITSLNLSLSSTHLLVGTSGGEIHVLALPSYQLIRTINVHAGPITHVSTMLRPPDLVGSAGLEKWPVMDVKPLQRTRVKPDDVHEISAVLRPTSWTESLDVLRMKPPAKVSQGGDGRDSEQLATVLEENKRLRTSLDRAIQINDKMWSGVVDLHLAQ